MHFGLAIPCPGQGFALFGLSGGFVNFHGLIYTDVMEAYNDKNLLFAARLTPYRSLSPRGFRILMGLIAFVCLSIGTVFFALGLWPVLGFMGLDVALIYFAFKLNYRSARAYEEVEISRQHILVRKVSPAGKAHEHIFQQFGTRFEVDRHEEIGITKMWLKNRKRELSFGYFLNPLDRESFSSEFALAMARAKA